MLATYGKYLRLFFLILISFFGVIGVLFLLLFIFKWFFRLLDMASITSGVYLFLMLLVPASIFISIYIIFYKRTLNHPSKIIKNISKVIFVAGILSWLISAGIDMVTFFRTGNSDTSYYLSFDKWVLIPNGAAIFIVAIIQALGQKKVD